MIKFNLNGCTHICIKGPSSIGLAVDGCCNLTLDKLPQAQRLKFSNEKRSVTVIFGRQEERQPICIYERNTQQYDVSNLIYLHVTV